jgi:phytoene dehydrogenase-like protein
MRKFIDAQLLISAQATSTRSNSLYAAAALDMPRRGVVQVEGGVGAIAKTLASTAQDHGTRIRYRQRVQRVQQTSQGYIVHTKKERYRADRVIFNLTLPDIASILDPDIRTNIKTKPRAPEDAWGAFMIYLGVDETALPEISTNHHQIVGPGNLSEAGSVFVSISPKGDESRAPAGRRAVTLSAHTRLDLWWKLHHEDRDGFKYRKSEYQERLLKLVEKVFPGLPESADPLLPATPLSFARFTGRSTGWVGGIPQTHLWRTRSPRLGRGLWMVGDSIFPGQSVAAVALGGLRVAREVLGLDASRRTTGVF